MYKNWKAICQITDTHFMWALALLNLATDLGRMVVERFPEYFSNEQQAGPIPLSVLIKKAQEAESYNNQFGPGDWHLVEYGAIPSHWPILTFSDGYDSSCQPIPDCLKSASECNDIGKIYEWEGKKIVLVDAYIDLGTWSFVPAELIAVDK